jgi:hypothetical protein
MKFLFSLKNNNKKNKKFSPSSATEREVRGRGTYENYQLEGAK